MTRPAMSKKNRVLILAALSALAFSFALLPSPLPAQEQFGRPGISIEAAKAPAVAARRARLMDIHKDGVILIPSQYSARGGLQDNLNFLYLTGIKESDAVLVLDPAGSPREVIYHRMPGAQGPRGQMNAGGPGNQGPRPGQAPEQAPAAPDRGVIEKPIDQLAS